MDSLELIQKMLDKKRITTNEAFIILQDLAKSQTEKQCDDKEIKKSICSDFGKTLYTISTLPTNVMVLCARFNGV